jgi:hypothetical protein
MNKETLAAAAGTTLAKGADIAFKTAVVVYTLQFLGIIR